MFLAKLIILCLLPLASFALPSDVNQPLLITSDISTYNYKTGEKTFEGHVKADQGTSHITADKLITKSNATRKIQEAIAYGLVQPAHYWTMPNHNKPIIHAHAGTIKYYPLEGRLAMQQHAYVTQGKNIFQGQLVTYDIREEVVNVPASSTGRSILVYNPEEA